MGSLVKTPRDVSIALVRQAEARRNDPRAVWGIPWGFPGLDQLTGGIHSPHMSVLMARPGVGKTTVMEQVAQSVCDYLATPDGKRDHPDQVVRLVLCEMTAEQFQQRMVCHRASVSMRRVQDGSLSGVGWERYKQAAREVARLPIEYLDTPQSLEHSARFIQSGRGGDDEGRKVAWWAVDYLQIHPLQPGRPNDGSLGAVTLASGVFRDLAKMVAPGLVLSQMSREVDKREDKRPTLADLRGSGAIEQDASVVLGIYREDIYVRVPDEERNEPRPAELLLLKNRDGETNRTVWMRWHPMRGGTFEDVSKLGKYHYDDDDEGEGEHGEHGLRQSA